MTQEVAVLSERKQQLLAQAQSGALTGTSQGGSLPFKTLVMVSDMGVETPGGKDVPQGSFWIKDTEHFASKVLFRPLIIAQKLMDYQQAEGAKFKLAGETIYFFDWNTQRIDSNGGVSLGREFGKAYKASVTPEQLEANKDKATLYLHTFGIVTINGVEEPVLFAVTGGKYGRLSNAIQNRKALNNLQPNQINFTLELFLPSKDPMLSAKEKAEAKNTYFNLVAMPLVQTVLPLEPVIDALDMFDTYISNHNKKVMDKHMLARQGGSSHDDITGDIIDVDYDELGAELDQLG